MFWKSIGTDKIGVVWLSAPRSPSSPPSAYRTRISKAMDPSYLFADSDLSSSVCDPAPAPDRCPADVVALRRLSEHLGALLSSPELGFCSDARITVGSAATGDPPREVHVHRCVLASRSAFFRERFAQGATELELRDLVEGFEVGFEALGAVLDYVYTGRVGPLPKGVCECVDEECDHVACWPAVDFMLQVLFASATFQISELVSLFQRRLLDILEKVATDEMLDILRVANLCGKTCSRLLLKCVEVVVKSDLDNVTLEKTLTSDIVKQIMKSRSDAGLHGPEGLGFPDRNVKSIYRALDSDDVELVKLLLDEGHTSLDDAYALHYAAAHCDSKITKKLLDLERADVNRKNHRGYTVLHIAAMRKEPSIIVSLLTKGARASDLTSDGKKAIQISKRRTRYIDYEKPNQQGKASCNDKLCIEVLEQRREEMSLPLAMMSGDLHQRLSYLEARVTLAKILFPKEAKVAMDNAHVDGTLEYTSNLPTSNQRMAVDSDRTPFEMKDEYISRMRALWRTGSKGSVLAMERTSSKIKSFGKKKKFVKKQKVEEGKKKKAELKKKTADKEKCFHCNTDGHWKRNYPTYLATLKNKKAGPSGGMHVIESNLTVSSASSWVLDSGSGAHLYTFMQDLEDSRRLRNGQMILRVENGARVATVAVGTYPLRLPSGLDLVLKDRYYVPTTSKNLISVSCLALEGYVISFLKDHCNILYKRNKIASSFLINGLYQLHIDVSVFNIK